MFHSLFEHPALDNPQKKNQKTHLGDPKIDQADGAAPHAGYPKPSRPNPPKADFLKKLIQSGFG